MLDALIPTDTSSASIPAENIETLTTNLLSSINQKGADSAKLQQTTQALLTTISTSTASKEVALPIAKSVAANPSLSPQVKADIIQTVVQNVVNSCS